MTRIIPPAFPGSRFTGIAAPLRVAAHACFAGSMALTAVSSALVLLCGAGGSLAERLLDGSQRLQQRALLLFTMVNPVAAALLRVRGFGGEGSDGVWRGRAEDDDDDAWPDLEDEAARLPN